MSVTNRFTKLRAVLGRKHPASTATDAVTPAPTDEIVVEVSVPGEDGTDPVTVPFGLSELLEIHTLSKLRERADQKVRERADQKGAQGRARSTELREKPDPADFKDKPIGDLLDALGIREDVDRYENEGGATTILVNLGRLLRGRGQNAD